jgi:hypothetical protein
MVGYDDNKYNSWEPQTFIARKDTERSLGRAYKTTTAIFYVARPESEVFTKLPEVQRNGGRSDPRSNQYECPYFVR